MIKYNAEIKRLAKRANQRMVEMEKHGYTSPAYKAVQASLEMMGRRSNKATGRRFSETGKGTENELRQQLAELQRFLGSKTSTVKGYKQYRKDVYEGQTKNTILKARAYHRKILSIYGKNCPTKNRIENTMPLSILKC